MSTSTGALKTTYPGQKRADKRTFNRRILLIIERSKLTNEDDRLHTSIPANTIKALLSTDEHHSLPPEAFYSQKSNSCTPCVPMFLKCRKQILRSTRLLNFWQLVYRTWFTLFAEHCPRERQNTRGPIFLEYHFEKPGTAERNLKLGEGG